MFLIVKEISRATWIRSTYISIGEKMCESGNPVMQALGTILFLFYFCRMPQGQAVFNSNGIKKEMRKLNTTLHVTYK